MIEPEVAYCDLDGLMELAENFISHIVQSVLKNRAPELASDRARSGEAEDDPAAVSAAALRRGGGDAEPGAQGGQLEQPFEYGNDFGSPDETWLSSQFDRPVMVHRYPADVKAFYMEPDPKDRELCAVRGRAGAGGLWRDHRRIAARVELRTAQEPHRAAQAAAARRSSGISTCAATAACRMRDSAWASSAWWRGCARWTTCGRRFRLRGRCTDLSVDRVVGFEFFRREFL